MLADSTSICVRSSLDSRSNAGFAMLGFSILREGVSSSFRYRNECHKLPFLEHRLELYLLLCWTQPPLQLLEYRIDALLCDEKPR